MVSPDFTVAPVPTLRSSTWSLLVTVAGAVVGFGVLVGRNASVIWKAKSAMIRRAKTAIIVARITDLDIGFYYTEFPAEHKDRG
jgi:hypothetical protein